MNKNRERDWGHVLGRLLRPWSWGGRPHASLRRRHVCPGVEALESRTLLSGGALDLSFGAGGQVLGAFLGTQRSAIEAVVQQPDGKIVVAGKVDATAAPNNAGVEVALMRFLADGSPDPTFGAGGQVVTDLSAAGTSATSEAAALAVQPDGKLVIAGRSGTQFALARYESDGGLDPTFGDGGKVVTAFQSGGTAVGTTQGADGLAIDAAGDIIAVGGVVTSTSGQPPYLRYERDFLVARFRPDGSLDPSFGSGGAVVTDAGASDESAHAVIVQGDGKIVVAGGSDDPNGARLALVRYNPDGSPDATFGAGGVAATTSTGGARRMAVASDGKLVVAAFQGQHVDLFRFDADGALDPTFGGGGAAVTGVGGGASFPLGGELAPPGLAVQADGAVLVGGYTSPDGVSIADFEVQRYQTDGSLDASFGAGGTVATDFAGGADAVQALALQGDGRVLAAGSAGASSTQTFALARYGATGSPDPSFAGVGNEAPVFYGSVMDPSVSGTALADLLVQPDGGAVVAGSARGLFALTRHLADGRLDPAFGVGGAVTTDFGPGGFTAEGAALQPDGKILVAGHASSVNVGTTVVGFYLERYDPDGSPDPTFGAGGKVVTALDLNPFGVRAAVQPDGKVVLAAYAPGSGGYDTWKVILARYEPDGALDAGFGAGGIESVPYSSAPTGIAIQPDGKILLGGTTLYRFNPDGSPDAGFGDGGRVTSGLGGSADPVLLEPDGTIVLVGQGAGGGSAATVTLARFLPDGRPDPAFGAGGVVTTAVAGAPTGAALQPDGRIVVVGDTPGAGSSPQQSWIARFNADGGADGTFTDNGQETIDVGASTPTAPVGVGLLPDGRILALGGVFPSAFQPTPGAYYLVRYQGAQEGTPDRFTLTATGALWEDGGDGLHLLSPAGTVLAIDVSSHAAGAPEVFAQASDHSLWVFDAAGWTLLSPADTIASLSAAPGGVVFVTAADASLWEYSGYGWQNLSPAGTILTAAAGVDAGGSAEVFALASDHSLWRYGAGAWEMLSPAGTIDAVSAEGDDASAVASDGSLWQHTAAGWALLSPAETVLSAEAGTDAGGAGAVFALAADHSLWRYTAVQGWALLSPAGTILSLRNVQGADVFAAAGDGDLWEFDGSAWSRVAFR